MDASCSYAIELYDMSPLQAVQWLYLVMSLASVVLVVYTARYYLHRTIFETITKELIIAQYIYIAFFSSLMIIVQTFCVFRYTLTMIISSFLVLHIGITIQHALSTFLFRSSIQKIAARLSILVSFVYPTVLGIFAYSKDSLEGQTAYCTGITANSANFLLVDLYVMLALTIFNTLASALLFMYNQHKLNAEQSFDLVQSFHRRQNLYAMRQFLPIASVHATVYGIFFISVILTENLQSSLTRGWYTVVNALANAIPWYCLLCPLMFLILIRRGHFARVTRIQNITNPEKNPDDIYFESLKEQWK